MDNQVQKRDNLVVIVKRDISDVDSIFKKQNAELDEILKKYR